MTGRSATPTDVVGLAAGIYPAAALEAAKVVIVHDLAVAMSARGLVGEMLEKPERWDGSYTDLLSGLLVDLPSAITRNAQTMHALTQDDAHFGSVTHVGTTALPLLLALGEASASTTRDLVAGFASAMAAAEVLGEHVSPGLAGRGIRATCVIGPIAAVVGAGRMLAWEPTRVQRAVSRVAASAFGTAQTWTEGTQEWLYQVAAAGLLAWQAARSSDAPWEAAIDPLWGSAGLFTVLGAPHPETSTGHDPRTAATRVSLKRYPVCTVNQVPASLLAGVLAGGESIVAVEIRMAPSFAATPGIDRSQSVDSWTRRLMSTPYCLAVMARTGDLTAADLGRRPAAVTDESVRAMTVVSDESLAMGEFVLQVSLADGRTMRLTGESGDVGVPSRAELDFAARRVAGSGRVEALLKMLDHEDTTVRDLLRATTPQKPRKDHAVVAPFPGTIHSFGGVICHCERQVCDRSAFYDCEAEASDFVPGSG